MDSDLVSTNTNCASQSEVPILALASTFVLAAAGTWLACSLFPARRRSISRSTQLCLGVAVACAGAITWNNRQEEVDAARDLVDHVNLARDARWLRKNPIAYA